MAGESSSSLPDQILSNNRHSLDALVQTYDDPSSELKICDTLSAGFQSHSQEDQSLALQWRLMQDETLLRTDGPVTKKHASLLVAAVLRRQDLDWFIEKDAHHMAAYKAGTDTSQSQPFYH